MKRSTTCSKNTESRGRGSDRQASRARRGRAHVGYHAAGLIAAFPESSPLMFPLMFPKSGNARNTGRKAACRSRRVEGAGELGIGVVSELVGDDRPKAGEEQQLAALRKVADLIGGAAAGRCAVRKRTGPTFRYRERGSWSGTRRFPGRADRTPGGRCRDR